MRMKRMAGAIAVSTLALAGLGVVGATAANAAVVNVSCGIDHQAELYGGPEQCFNYTGSGTHWIEVDGYGNVCATGSATVYVNFSNGNKATLYNGHCADGVIYNFGIYPNP